MSQLCFRDPGSFYFIALPSLHGPTHLSTPHPHSSHGKQLHQEGYFYYQKEEEINRTGKTSNILCHPSLSFTIQLACCLLSKTFLDPFPRRINCPLLSASTAPCTLLLYMPQFMSLIPSSANSNPLNPKHCVLELCQQVLCVKSYNLPTPLGISSCMKWA